MTKVLIKLTYRHVIDATSVTDFEKKVFNTSYQEFLMKSQAYNMDGKFKTFKQIRNNDGRANSLHYKLSIAVTHHIDALENKIPGLEDTFGNPILFETLDFKLVASDLTEKSDHKVSINYVTGGLTLLNVIQDNLLLAIGDQRENHDPICTFMLKMQNNLSISEYHEVLSDVYLS
jgi:hypothetical protein